MTGYLTPADVGVSDNYQKHLERNSKEPGTDYKTAYGTDCRMPGNGVIAIVDNSSAGAEGRRLEINMDNGEVIDMIHGARINARVGDRVTRGQKGIFISGASGNGVDWYYGPHVHVTRRASKGLPYKKSIDFELAVDNGSTAGGGSKPFTPPVTLLSKDEFTMEYALLVYVNKNLPEKDNTLLLVNLKDKTIIDLGNSQASAVRAYYANNFSYQFISYEEWDMKFQDFKYITTI